MNIEQTRNLLHKAQEAGDLEAADFYEGLLIDLFFEAKEQEFNNLSAMNEGAR